LIESNGRLGDLTANGYELAPSDDESLWNILVSDGRRWFYMYLDKLNPRFWPVHSAYCADESEPVIQSLVINNQARLDLVLF
jgi:hypothetical protein